MKTVERQCYSRTRCNPCARFRLSLSGISNVVAVETSGENVLLEDFVCAFYTNLAQGCTLRHSFESGVRRYILQCFRLVRYSLRLGNHSIFNRSLPFKWCNNKDKMKRAICPFLPVPTIKSVTGYICCYGLSTKAYYIIRQQHHRYMKPTKV